MTGHDDALLDSVALLALGVLPAGEANEVKAHAQSCELCRNEYLELRSAADAVGLSAEAGAGQISELQSARMRLRLMRAVRLEPGRAGDVPAAPARTGRRTDPRLSYAAVAALVIFAVFSALNFAALRSQRTATDSQVALLRGQVTAERAAVSALRERLEAQSRVASVLATGRRFVVRDGQVVKSGAGLVIALHDLPAPPKGKVYQAWTLDRGARTMTPSITFTPDAKGNAIVALPQVTARVAVVAVSVEPAGGSKAPTSQPTFVRKLS
jgi:hypothetical protein